VICKLRFVPWTYHWPLPTSVAAPDDDPQEQKVLRELLEPLYTGAPITATVASELIMALARRHDPTVAFMTELTEVTTK
jgi:hypothetical protein